GIAGIDVLTQGAVGERASPDDEAGCRADQDGDDEALGDGEEGRNAARQEGRIGEDMGDRRDDSQGRGDIGRGEGAHDHLPQDQDRRAGIEPRQDLGGRASFRGGAHAHTRQRAKCCSTIRPMRIRTRPRIMMMMIAASTPAVSKFCDAFMMSWPSPVELKKNSAAIMPTRARPTAWRTTVMVKGRV